MLSLQHLSYSFARWVTAGAAAKGRQVPTWHLPLGRKGNKQAGSTWAGFGAKVTTLPPKCVQSTDLLGKDNLGRKVLINEVTHLAQKKPIWTFHLGRLDHFLVIKSAEKVSNSKSPWSERGSLTAHTGGRRPTKGDQVSGVERP